MAKKALLSWSGGKDSALSLFKALQDPGLEVAGLFTVVEEDSLRVGLQGVDALAVKAQAGSLQLPIHFVFVSRDGKDAYRRAMMDLVVYCIKNEYTALIFGDIHLSDLRAFREEMFHPAGLSTKFPLWGMSSLRVLEEWTMAGFKAVISSVNSSCFPPELLGKDLSLSLLENLPDIDPAGELGEYHTFCYDGPGFHEKLHIKGSKPEVGEFNLGGKSVEMHFLYPFL